MMIKTVLTGFIILVGQVHAGGSACTSLITGIWSNTNTWNCTTGTGLPEADTTVTINNGHTVSLDVDASIGTLVVFSGGDFDVAGSGLGLTLTLNTSGSDLSEASMDLFENLNITATGDLTMGAVDGAFDLNVGASGSTDFTQPVGANTALNSLVTSGQITLSNGLVTTAGNQIYPGGLTLAADTTLTLNNNGQIQILGSGGAFDLTINNAGETYLSGTIGSPRHSSFTTNTGGTTRVVGATFIQVDGSNPVTINDLLRVQGRLTIDQAGTGDVVFNGEIVRLSGGVHELTVNDVSGQTIFNNNVTIGEFTSNDGAGADSTVINTSSFVSNSSGADNGLVRFNDPVLIMTDVTMGQDGNGSITFANTLDAEPTASSSNLVINSSNNVVFNTVGGNNLLDSLTTNASGTTRLNGPVTVDNPLTFNDPVTILADLQVQSQTVTFNDTVDLQDFDLTVSAFGASMNGVVSGTGDLISEVVTLFGIAADNTYSGNTIVNEGLFDLADATVNNNIASSAEIQLNTGNLRPHTMTGVFQLADGQTLTGIGNVLGTLQTASGSLLKPSTGGAAMTIDALNMDTGSTHQVEINGVTPISHYSQMSIAEVNLDNDTAGGASLSVNLNASTGSEFEFIIIDNTGVNPVTGTYNGLPEGAVVGVGGDFGMTVSYLGGDGNDVVLGGLCQMTITVSDAGDSGAGTLRQAVLDVCAGGTINFASDLTITLASEIEIEKDLTIDGSGQAVTLSGGGVNRIFNLDVGVTVNMNTLNFNDGFNADVGGGIISNGALTITDSMFDGHTSNSGPLGGGAIFNSDVGTLTVTGSTFTNNSADKGGAIFNDGGLVNISNNTFTQNGSSASEGGAIHNRGTLISTNNTIAGNGTTSTTGGGLSTWNGDHTLNNTMIADNNGINDCYIELSNSSQTNSHSLIESGNCDAALTDDPQLQSLADNGGTTQTMAPGLTSPVVDAGSNALCTATDQRGVVRPQLNACDIGAYETEDLGIIYVNGTTSAFSGVCTLGSCWAGAYDNLQDALEVAVPTAQIWVAAGVYYPDVGAEVSNDDPDVSFQIGTGVQVYGGFNGTETELDQRDPATNLTVLSGDIEQNDTDADADGVIENVSDINGTNAYMIIDQDETGIVLDGFTITAGDANGVNPGHYRGGGIYCSASGDSGHVFNNMIWQANRANASGGALFNCNGNISNSLFVNNESGSSGGAADFGDSSVPELFNVSFINNTASISGGALVHQGIVIDRAYFAGNEAGFDGGAIYGAGGMTLSNSALIGNSANNLGGAVMLLLNNTLTNVTLTGNVANSLGGAIYYETIPVRGEITAMENSIVWNNEDSSGVGTVSAGVSGPGVVLWTNSLLQSSGGSTSWNPAAGNDGGNNIDLDPEFVQDIDLMAVPTVVGNARLTLGSAAIGSGLNAFVDTSEDLDGNNRIDGGTVDMGAYEYSDLIFANGFED